MTRSQDFPRGVREPPERSGFARSVDGTRIYFEIWGNGPRTLLIADGLACDGFNWRYFVPHFARNFTVILTKYRAHGLSDIPYDLHNLTIEYLVEDVRSVLEANHSKSAIVVGYSMGVQVALEFAYKYPNLTDALLLLNGSYQYPIDTFHDAPTLKNALPLIFHVSTRYSALVQPIVSFIARRSLLSYVARRFECNYDLVKADDLVPYFDHIGRMDLNAFGRLINYASTHSAEPYLPHIKMPALILGGERDSFTPGWVSRLMYERLPDAELTVVRGGSHVTLLEQPTLVHLRIEKFLHRRGLLDAGWGSDC